MSAIDYDVCVIGGGIQGVGAAQASAAAGHSVLVLEERALAAGTSSRSSKLIHGGLRYLESGRLHLVAESLAERRTLLANAPELVRLVPFSLPIYRDTSRRPWQIRAGLSLYSLLGKLAPETRFESLHHEAWALLDGLRTTGLQAVFRYHDGQTDDALLTRAVMQSALELGAELACPARFVAAERHGVGFEVRWEASSSTERATCAVLVNAAGPWVEEVRARIRPLPRGMAIELVQGAHIELQGRLARGMYYVEAPSDRRAVFAMPWRDRTLVGTTESVYRGDPADTRPLPQEIDYLLATWRHYFPDRPRDVLASWSGLRVLPAGSGAAFSRPRDVQLIADEPAAPRVVSIYGGKLTGYRATAAKLLTLLSRTLEPRPTRADTRFLKLPVPARPNPPEPPTQLAAQPQ